ncbi:helix-turn-helix domain-containing protein [Bacillus sp. ISL-46]|uniref:helix-turn-helix domain-containing protein n=1 Tax=Bacillus sp. ISL-46 TaxID=2819129 RepID=UPI001BE9E46A|nr:helix-turn-helix domain-containing protein [Bacillus sp. ISL-46]MBT2724680.1 helix-turn-helix domain-containing protein [Bacillus sp. ISL-46]
MAKSAYTAQEEYELIMAYLDRQTFIPDFCCQNNISKNTIKKWMFLFETYGIKRLEGSSG